MEQPPLERELDAVVVGGGPAGLMAAETLARAGRAVHLFDAMPSVGRKFLLAGKGGLNLTHGEPLAAFVGRYGAHAPQVAGWLDAFGPDALRAWARDLGVETFVGSSGRVFPHDLKAAPLLRAWLHRLRRDGVVFHPRWRWLGFDGGVLRFASPAGDARVTARALVLALGGASWPQLGSDGAWVPLLRAAGVAVAPLQASNCGFEVAPAWSAHLRERFAGAPLKAVRLRCDGFDRRGEFVLSDYGVEGSLVYAAGPAIRAALERDGRASVELDLLPDHDAERVAREVAHPRGSRSFSSHLKSRLGVDGVKAALLHEVMHADAPRAASLLKALPLTLVRARPIAEAISSAGGVRAASLDPGTLMLRARPGVFCAGEMLDWDAPTGGYLLQASLASGRVAGDGAARWNAPNPA